MSRHVLPDAPMFRVAQAPQASKASAVVTKQYVQPKATQVAKPKFELSAEIGGQIADIYAHIERIEAFLARESSEREVRPHSPGDSAATGEYDVVHALTDNEPPISIQNYYLDPTATVVKKASVFGTFYEVQSDPNGTVVAIRAPGQLQGASLISGSGEPYSVTIAGTIEGPFEDAKSGDLQPLQVFNVTFPFRQVKKLFEAEVPLQVIIDGIVYKTAIKIVPAASRQTVSPYITSSPFARKEKSIVAKQGEPLYVIGRGQKWLAIVDENKQYVDHTLVLYRGFERVLVTWDRDVYVGFFDEALDTNHIVLGSLQLVRLERGVPSS